MWLVYFLRVVRSTVMFNNYTWMLFSVRADGKVSKPEANFLPPRTQKKTTWTLFSVLVDGNLSTHGAIFRPWQTENSLRCAYVSVPADGNLHTALFSICT